MGALNLEIDCHVLKGILKQAMYFRRYKANRLHETSDVGRRDFTERLARIRDWRV